MKLKKWGSLLTAISMVASMAAYVPATVSADEISANYSAVQLAAEETEAVTTDLFSGTLLDYSKVSYTISSVVTPAAEEGAEATTEYVLTLSPKTVNTVYTIPDEVIYELAYTLIGKTTEDTADFATVSGLASTLTKVVVTGAAQISYSAFAIDKPVDDNDDVSDASLEGVAFEIDCQATYAATADATEFTDIEFDYDSGVVETSIAGVVNGTIKHTMQAGTKNHKCKYGDKVDTSFAAHDFTKAGGATVADGAHICACGKSSEDYKTTDGYSQNIHTWDEKKHECTDCGADMFYAHASYTKYVSNDSTTHVKTCTACEKTLAEAEEHTYAIKMGENSAKACADCGYEHEVTTTKNEHVYAYSWVVDEDGVAQFTEVGTATGYVCACGSIKEHNAHNYVKANGMHLCGCGAEQKHEEADYTQKYNDKGVLVAVGTNETGVICADCGAVDPDHKTCEDTFCNTTEHKHFCYCGEEIAEPTHHPIIDEVNNKHICEDCKLDLSDDEHAYSYVYVTFTDDKTNATLNAEAVAAPEGVAGLICACGAVKSHTHNYEYGVNQEHYCVCGAKEATATHKYVTVDENGEAVTGTATGTTYQQCSICGALKNHTHTYDYESDCTCTNPLCNATDHDYYVNGSRHICNNCGNVADPDDASTHDYKVDTENHKHVCECGDESTVHNFVNHECECGATNHKKSESSKEVNGVKVHFCEGPLEDGETACTYVYTEEEDYGHTYDAITEKCKDCEALDPDHTHLVKTVGASDTCRCGATVDHAWGLATDNFAANHQCVNYAHDISVDSDTDKVTITEGDRCAKTAAHVFTTTDDEGNKVTLDFCECGAMNPTVLVKAGVLNATKDTSGNITYVPAVNLETLVATVKTEYLVKLTKAYDAVAAYDITNTINTEAACTDISVAADEKSQATALAAVETFKTVYADKDNNQAASSAKIGFVLEKDEDGIVIVDHSDRGYAAFADGSVNTSNAVYDMVGETVTIQVKNKPGYTFAGWYATQTPSATDEPLSTSAAYDVEIKDGHYTYYAMFKENAKKTVSFGEGIKYFSNITAAADESNWTTGTAGFPETLSFLANEELVIMADDNYFTDKGIAGITDKYGNIVSNNVYVDVDGNVSEPTSANKANAYKMIVAYDNNFNVSVYSTDTASLGTTGCYVQFQVGGKTVAAKKFDTRDVTSIQPADPEMTGYEFLGWYFMHDEDQKIQKLKTVTEATGVLVPKFEKIDDLTVTVKNGTIDSDSVKETYTYGDKILVTADLQDATGKYFSGWYDENGKLLSEKRTDYIIVTKSMTITAQYTRDTELVLEAGVDLTYSRTTSALTLTATRYLTDDMTLVEVGTLYAVGEVTDLTIENTELGRKTMSATDVSGKNGNFNVTLNLSSEAAKTSVISARSYFIYEDADGVNHTVYSEAVYADPVK